MKQTKLIMGMPITVEIVGRSKTIENEITYLFSYFKKIDRIFSTYKKNSEISKIRKGQIEEKNYSNHMRQVLKLCKLMEMKTGNYFNIESPKGIDPSGLVKGWAIEKATNMLKSKNVNNFYIEAGGDIAVYGTNNHKKPWSIGIRNPFNKKEIVKVIHLTHGGVATSGNYERGKHIYNPNTKTYADEIASITVVGPNVMEADVLATAAFAIGKRGINFISKQKNYSAYMIEKNKIAQMTQNFQKLIKN